MPGIESFGRRPCDISDDLRVAQQLRELYQRALTTANKYVPLKIGPGTAAFAGMLLRSMKIALAIIGGSAVIGATGFFAAPAVAAYLGSLGLLGATATTGATISTLSGAALTNASLAALGGGAWAAGGYGIAGGTAVIATISTSVGGAATGAVFSCAS